MGFDAKHQIFLGNARRWLDLGGGSPWWGPMPGWVGGGTRPWGHKKNPVTVTFIWTKLLYFWVLQTFFSLVSSISERQNPHHFFISKNKMSCF